MKTTHRTEEQNTLANEQPRRRVRERSWLSAQRRFGLLLGILPLVTTTSCEVTSA